MNYYYEGATVEHRLFGKGKIIEINGNIAVVKFEGEEKNKKILKSFLKLDEANEQQVTYEAVNLNKEKRDEYYNQEKLVIIPENIKNLDTFTKYEKDLVKYFEKNYNKGILAIGTNPIGKDNRISFFFEKNSGLVAFIIFLQEISNIEEYIEMFERDIIRYEEKLYKVLLESKILYAQNESKKILKFPYKLIGLFPNIDYRDLKDKLTTQTHIFCNNMPSTTKLFENYEIEYDEDFKEVDIKEFRAILARVIPEYTTVIFEKEPVEVKKINKIKKCMEKITGNETAYKVFALEKEQIAIINKMRQGVKLFLANPGTGKSVIVLSKAYRISDSFESRILVTCYNKNLCESYQIKKELAGYNGKDNLYIMTYHSLIDAVLRSIGLRISDIVINPTDFNDEYNIASEYIMQKIRDNTIQLRFKAILIDEVQLFIPKWIDMCYMLLEEDGYFEMYGDLNQDVKKTKRKGKASWQNTKELPSIVGKVEYLTKNYRNTIEINDYLKDMVNTLNDNLNYIGCSISKLDYEIKSEAIRHGCNPVIINTKQINMTEKVIEAIIELKEKYGLSDNDICIIFPYTQNRALKYYNAYWIEKELDNRGIGYSEIYGEERIDLVSSNGITITTIDSSIGLEFKAVILCGLIPMEFYYINQKMYKIPSIDGIKNSKNDEIINQYCSNIRKIYTAASRAREYLYIINDIQNVKSSIHDIIEPKGGSKYESRY